MAGLITGLCVHRCGHRALDLWRERQHRAAIRCDAATGRIEIDVPDRVNDELLGFHGFDPGGLVFAAFVVAIFLAVDVGFATAVMFETLFELLSLASTPSRFFITL